MPKKPVSLTLDEDNLLWVRSQSAAGRYRSLSDAVDRILTAARTEGHAAGRLSRSVVNTVEINPDDPNLEAADAYVASLFAESARRPWVVREPAPASRSKSKTRNLRKTRRG